MSYQQSSHVLRSSGQLLLHAPRTKTEFGCLPSLPPPLELERHTSCHQMSVITKVFQTPSQNRPFLSTPSTHLVTAHTSDLSFPNICALPNLLRTLRHTSQCKLVNMYYCVNGSNNKENKQRYRVSSSFKNH